MQPKFWQTTRMALLSVLLGTTSSLLAETYSLVDLGPLVDVSGRTESRPNDINPSGFVAGVNALGGSYRAMLYQGSWTNLGTLGGAESLAFGIDGIGRVVGYSETASGETHAFLWTPDGTDGVEGNPRMKDLDTLGGIASQAAAINQAGQITGYSDVSRQGEPRQHAFIYSAGKMTDLAPKVSPLPISFGYAINNSGHIVGVAYDADYTAPQAFFYDGNAGVALGPPDAQGSTALAINDGDQVAGYLTTADYFDHAFHYAGGVLTDLGALDQGRYSYAFDINNHNVIVGGSFIDQADSIYHAFVWTGGALRDLNTMLDSSGAGWTLLEARAINDAGQIVGIGSYGGSQRAFLLNPSSGPIITEVRAVGADVVLKFQTVLSATYSVEASPTLVPAAWSAVFTGIAGTGQVVTVTNVNGAALDRRFYRIKLSGQ